MNPQHYNSTDQPQAAGQACGQPVIIEAEGSPTISELREADKLSGRYWEVLRAIFLRIFLLFTFVCILVFSYGIKHVAIMGMALLGIGISVFHTGQYFREYILAKIRDRRECEKKIGYFQSVRVQISHQGIHVDMKSETDAKSANYKWKFFVGHRTGRSVVLLYYSFPWGHMTAARSTFSSDSDWEAFLDMASSRLPKC